MYFFGDGFDLYRDIGDAAGHWSFVPVQKSVRVASRGRFPGSLGLTGGPGAGVGAYIVKDSGSNNRVHHISVAIKQTVPMSDSSEMFFFALFDGSNEQCDVVFTRDGAIELYSGGLGGVIIATYTGAMTAINTWYTFEIEVVVHRTAGALRVRKNGNTSNDFSATSLNTCTNSPLNDSANIIGIGYASGGSDYGGGQTIDDFLWRSDPSSVPWIGDVRCLTRMPVSDNSVAFTRAGGVVPLTPNVMDYNSTTFIGSTSARYSPFTAPCDGTIATASIQIWNGYTGSLKCSVFANSSNNTPGSILGSATPISNPINGQNNLTFGTPVSVARGATYWFGFESSASANAFIMPASAVLDALYGMKSVTSTTSYANFPVANPTVATSNVPSAIFTVNVTPTTPSNAALLGEVVQDATDGGCVYSSTNGQADLCAMESSGALATNVFGVITRTCMVKSDAGSRSGTVLLKSGTTTVQGSSTPLNTTWGWIARTDLVDPSTGAAWTRTGIDNALIGSKVTA